MKSSIKIQAWIRHNILLISIISLVVFLGLSVGLSFVKWWYCFHPTFGVYLLEWGARIYKGYKTGVKAHFYPPLWLTISEYLKKKIQPKTAQETLKTSFRISHISQWMLSEFMQCSFFDDFSCFGDNPRALVLDHYNDLLIQYYDAKKDHYLSERQRIKSQIAGIEYQWAVVNILAAMLKELYLEETAKGLRNLYKQYTFTPETWEQDLRMVSAFENTRGKLNYDRLCKRLEDLDDANKKGDKEYTKDEQYQNFLTTIAYIEKYQGYGLDTSKCNMAYFAILENSYQKEVERLQEEVKNMKQ